MPPSPAYPDTVRTTVTYLLGNGDIAQNVFHWLVDDADTFGQTQADAMATEVVDAWNDQLKSLQHTSCSYRHTQIQKLKTSPYETFDYPANAPGISSSPYLAPQLAACITLKTAHPGRRGRGRMYIPGLCEASNATDGTIETTSALSIEGYADRLRTFNIAAGTDVAFAVLSRLDGVPYVVTSNPVNTRWDVQRRRANRRLP